MNEPTPITLLFLQRKGDRWRTIGTAATYFDAILLGERAGLHGGHWWFRTRHPEPVTAGSTDQPGLFDECNEDTSAW